MSTASNEIKSQMDRIQEQLKNQSEYFVQLKETHKKIRNDIKVTQTRIDTFNGALQAFELSLKAVNSEPKGEE